MSRPRTNAATRTVAAVVTLGAVLAGCSDIYFDRRDTIALSGGDAVAANMAEQTVDPWPPHSGNTNIAFNGERMQRAVQCYRADKVARPTDLNTTVVPGSTPSTTTGSCEGQMNSGSAQPAGNATVAAEPGK